MNNFLSIVSSARKLVIKVPHAWLGVKFPKGAKISDYGKGNQRPIIVVQNATDGGSWQGAKSGQYIVINEVPEYVAEAALDILGGENYSIADVRKAVRFLVERGCTDQYTTDQDFVDTMLSPAGRMLGAKAGIMKRDDRDLCTVYRASDGTLYVTAVQGELCRIEPEILRQTYRNTDGTSIDLSKIPTHS